VPLRPCLLHRSPPPLPLSPQDARPRGEDKSPPETLHHCRAHFSAATRCNDTLFQTAISGTSNVAEAGEPERQSVVVRSKKALICNLNPPHYERGVHTAPPHPTSPWLRRFRVVRIQKSSLNNIILYVTIKLFFICLDGQSRSLSCLSHSTTNLHTIIH